MKRIIAFLLMISMLGLLTACGNSIEEDNSGDSYISETQSSPVKVSADEAKQIASEYLIKTETRYNKDGKIISITTYEYDEQFRCATETYEYRDSFDSAYNFSYIAIYEYDVYYGWLKQISIVDNINDTMTDDWTEYSYDSAGNSTAIMYSDGKLSQKTFYNKDNLALEEQVYTDSSTFYYTYEYDNNGDVVLENASKKSSDGSVYNWGDIHYEYEYTTFGLKSKKTNMNNGAYATYEYDDNYCLTKINDYSPSFAANGKAEFNGWTEYEYISKSNVLASIENEKQESEDRKETLINDIRNGAAYSSYKELYSLTKTLDSDDMDRFRGEWYREDGSSIKVGLIGDVEMECYDGDRKAAINGVLQYVSTNIALFGCEVNDGIGYILFEYNNNSVDVYSLLAVNGNKEIAGTYKATMPNASDADTSMNNDALIADYSKCEVKDSAIMKQYEGIEDTWGCFRVYDVTSANEIYFEVDWYRATGFGGVAKLKDGIATFDIQYGETKLKGYFTISDDAVALNLEESTLMVGSGVYKYNYNTGVYRDSTLAGYGTLDHNLFISYLEKNNKSSDITWEFLGSPGEIFFVTGADYPGSFDLYKVTAANGAETYYACLPYDYQAEYGVYQIGLNGTLQFVWKP